MYLSSCKPETTMEKEDYYSTCSLFLGDESKLQEADVEEKHPNSANIKGLYHQPMQEIKSYYLSHFHALGNTSCSNLGSRGTIVSFDSCKEQFFTLESSAATNDVLPCDSSSVFSSKSSFSPQASHSSSSDPHHSHENLSGSPSSGCSVSTDEDELKHTLRELEISLLGPESDIGDSCYCSFHSGTRQATSMATWKNQIVDEIPRLNLKELLIGCAQSMHEADLSMAMHFMEALEQRVSVSGEPLERLGAYLLEGLRARLERSGSSIYKALKCEEPTSSELMSYMSIIYEICPYWKFGYSSANVVIQEAMENEPKIHIIDFQIAQGSQWIPLIQDLAKREGNGGPPLIRITGVDDSQSSHARGGGLHIVGQRLSQVSQSCGVRFEFHAAAMSGSEVELCNLGVQPGEALAVNFPYVLHHIPDESVSTQNHRDRLLRLVKSLSPKVVTIIEQESNTNTSPFLSRFVETLDYYTAMFESIDAAALPRDDKQRIRAEQHCVARDIVNMIACEGAEREERHELLGKWRSRLTMAGFTPYPLSPGVAGAVRKLLQEYSQNYTVEESNEALYLRWMKRAMVTSSAWR